MHCRGRYSQLSPLPSHRNFAAMYPYPNDDVYAAKAALPLGNASAPMIASVPAGRDAVRIQPMHADNMQAGPSAFASGENARLLSGDPEAMQRYGNGTTYCMSILLFIT